MGHCPAEIQQEDRNALANVELHSQAVTPVGGIGMLDN